MNDDRHVVEEAKRLLDESVEHLDARTLAGLTRARIAALEAPRMRHRVWRSWPVATLAAASLLLVLAVSLKLLRPETGDNILVADLGLLTAEDPVEFIEDIDFYEWLSTVEAPIGDLSGQSGPMRESGLAGLVHGCSGADSAGARGWSDRISGLL